jgi:hypothetical protein
MSIRSKFAGVLVMLFAVPAFAAGVDQENLDEFGRGIIADYGDMARAEPIEWAWVKEGVRLADHRFEPVQVRNLTAIADLDMEQGFDETLALSLERSGARDASAPVLTVETAIYWANRANRAKAWIPYAGGHLAQAGVGVELVFKDAAGQVVAKLRHSGREGDALEAAAKELVDEISGFVRTH